MPPPAVLPHGIDVSSHQGAIDWEAVAGAGLAFAFTKATESTNYVNPTFPRNWDAIKANGMARGAYHFARPETNGPVREADFFVNVVEARGIETGDILVLDLESGSGDLSGWTLDFLQHVEQRVGFKPILYTGPWIISGNHLANRPELGDYGLWLAAYQPGIPPAPDPWEVIAFWQYSDKGSVPGIVGNVDMNIFNGPADRIVLYGKPAADEPTEPSEPTVTLASVRASLVEIEAHAVAAFDGILAEIRALIGSIPE